MLGKKRNVVRERRVEREIRDVVRETHVER